jgi:hypothetical protein
MRKVSHRYTGGASRIRATIVRSDQPRVEIERAGASKIPHRVAREIQNNGMREV